MSFSDEISEILSLTKKCPRYLIYNKIGGYFECVKSIDSITSEKIVLQLFDGKLSVEGQNLSIKKCVLGDVCISGKILKVANI